jgi:hypothetical protein
MPPTTSLITCVTGYVATAGNHLSGRQALARWASSQPALRGFSTLADVVVACRDGAPAEQDRLLGALLGVAHDDQLAQLTVIAALCRKLSGAVSSWRRAGASAADLDALQADLVTRCWEVVVVTAAAMANGAAPPPRLALELVGQAWDAFRVPRRRERRAGAQQVGMERLGELATRPGRSAADALACEIGSAVRAGHISAKAAAPVFLTRVVGYSPAEAAHRLGVTPAVVRALRSRAERQLVA